MLRSFIAVFSLVTALPAIAQQQVQAAGGGSIASEWDIRTTVKVLNQQTAQLLPILDSLKVKEWTAAGASSVYEQQLDSAKVQLQGFSPAVTEFERHVEKLSSALDVFFRLQNLDAVLGSLTDGVTRYQNPALGELMQGILGQYQNSRQQLRQYMLDLATSKEQEYELMDREAQRCRGDLLRQSRSAPPPPPPPASASATVPAPAASSKPAAPAPKKSTTTSKRTKSAK
jgi:hypothetical protein